MRTPRSADDQAPRHDRPKPSHRVRVVAGRALSGEGGQVRGRPRRPAGLCRETPASVEDALTMDTKPEHFADGLHFPECPRWHDGALWVSDMWAHTVLRFEPDGSRHAVHTFGADEEPGGLGWLPDGRLVVVGMEGRRLYRLDVGTATVYADLSGLAPWALNDMVVTGDGNAYVSQIGFDIHGGSTPLASTALLRVTPGGEQLVAAEEMVVPNGIALSGDGGTMVVAETFAARLSRFRVEADGSLTDRQVFAEIAPVAGRRRAGPDGICLDEAGAPGSP